MPGLGTLRDLYPRSKADLVIRLGIALSVAVSLFYLEFGQVNSDEAWYLYASRLAIQGWLPYYDFAYTQMPLLPYIYGVFQVVQPGLFWGRVLTVLISLGTFGMSLVIARRYGGTRAGGLVALFFAAFTFGAYYNSIVKTYALISFFFTASLLVLSSRLPDTTKYPVALGYAFAAAMVRVSALLFVAPVFFYGLIAAPRLRTRALLVIESAVASLGLALLFLPDWPTVRWNLFDSHLRHWAQASTLTQIVQILTERLPDVVRNFGPVLVLFAAALFFLLSRNGWRAVPREAWPVIVAALGLGLFAASHLVNGLWDAEYLVPAVTASLPVLAVALSRVYREQENQSRLFFQGTLVAALLLLPLTESLRHVDVTGRQLPLAEIDQAAAFVAQHSQPNDPILALEALGVALNANRSALPGMTLAQFSLQRMDRATAQRMHLVNAEMLVEAVNQTAVPLVLLTDGDWGLISTADPSSAGALRRTLDERYQLALTVPKFGQFARNLYIYAKP